MDGSKGRGRHLPGRFRSRARGCQPGPGPGPLTFVEIFFVDYNMIFFFFLIVHGCLKRIFSEGMWSVKRSVLIAAVRVSVSSPHRSDLCP